MGPEKVGSSWKKGANNGYNDLKALGRKELEFQVEAIVWLLHSSKSCSARIFTVWYKGWRIIQINASYLDNYLIYLIFLKEKNKLTWQHYKFRSGFSCIFRYMFYSIQFCKKIAFWKHFGHFWRLDNYLDNSENYLNNF